MSEGERKAVLSVERGLHMLAYRWKAEPAARPAGAPAAHVSVLSGTISIISAPGAEDGVLASPGQALVILAETAGTIELTLRAVAPGGSLTADIELKSVEAPRPATLCEIPVKARAALPKGGAEFVATAHVSLRGDLTAGRGDWICGPDAPGRIEGLEIKGFAGDLPLEYQVASGGRMSGWTPWLPAGSYAGSRGKASPLIGLRIRLTPDAAPSLALKAEAVFLGAPAVTRIGREIELSGASLLDPLVGLKLDFVEAGDAAIARPEVFAPRTPASLRVFRRPLPAAEAA